MRFRLIDLVIASTLIAMGGAITNILISLDNKIVSLSICIVGGVVCYALVSSPLYRLFRLYALLLPKCPACGDQNRHYWSELTKWPMETATCATCQACIELCHDGTKCQWRDTDSQKFILLWPFSFGGRWQRVQRTVPTGVSSEKEVNDA